MFINPFTSPFPSAPFINSFRAVATPKQEDVGNRYINFNAGNDGCMVYRRGFVSNHIVLTGYGDVVNLTKMVGEREFYRGIKCVTLQRQASLDQKKFIQYLKTIQSDYGFKLVYEVDDVVFREEIPDYNASKHAFDNDEVRQNCIDMINMVDEVTVTCKFMRDLYIEKTGQTKISVVPNFMPYWWSGHQYNYRRICDALDKNKKKPRIVYAGSGAHFDIKNLNNGKDDFSHVVKFFVDNRHKYQFVFIGACPPDLIKYVHSKEIELHPWKTLLEYPSFLSSLNAQLFVAPLMNNNFNKSKSDIKFIEAAQLGIPCLCQDLETYSTAPSSMRFTTSEELEYKVEFLTNWKNRSKYYQLVPELRKIGESRFLEHPQNIGSVLESLDTPWGSPLRKYISKWNA